MGVAPPSGWRGEGHTYARVSVCVPRVRYPVSISRFLNLPLFLFELVQGCGSARVAHRTIRRRETFHASHRCQLGESP